MKTQTKTNNLLNTTEAFLTFKKCKACGSKNLFQIDYDFYCSDCEWDSIAIDVSSGNFAKRIGFGGANENSCETSHEINQLTESDVA